ncbi:MAG: DUF4861 domain-containing protein [Bacteroidales bacterium]|nr:DUF4861 domain-containing protein [Bacteroidales bacterium]
MKTVLTSIFVLFLFCSSAAAQTASSLFWRSDSLQVQEIVSETGNQYNKVGHHGPAVENSHMALRIYFNDSGAVDLYSKSGRGMELKEYKWYPDSLQIANGAGNDEYLVGKTVGLGGFALWDGEKEIKLVATKGRTARVGDTKKGSYAEMIAYGVEYAGDLVDISIRIDMNVKTREAVVTAKELSGKKVMFLTGVNYHEGQTVRYDEKHILVWGIHTGGKTPYVTPIGAAMTLSGKMFPTVEKTDDMVRAISKPTSEVQTKVVATSTREAELNTMKRFEAYIFN